MKPERALLFVPTIKNLKAAAPLALDDDVAVLRAQLDLPNISARAVNFLGDQGSALMASDFFASRNIPAAIDANCRWRGVEIGLQHRVILPSMYAGAIIW